MMEKICGKCSLFLQDLGYTVFSTVCAFYLPCAVMMVIYGKVFQAARARIHKKRFRSHPQPHQQQQQQQQPGHQELSNRLPQNPSENQKKQFNHRREDEKEKIGQDRQQQQLQQQQGEADVDAGLEAGQFVSDGVVHAVTPDDGAGDSVASRSSPTDRQVLGTTVTMTVFTCDDDEDDDDEVERISAADGVQECPPYPVTRPTHLALSETDRNGTMSPTSCSLETPTRSAHLLGTSPLKNSPSASLRSSWLDLTKQFIMDRRRGLSPKSKVGDCNYQR